MKIQLNGFDIEINTEETNMTVKVMDASGKELSNNTFEQSLDSDGTPNPAEMPSAEETASDDSNPEGNEPPTEDTEGVQGDDTAGAPEVQGEEEVTEEELGEGLIPSFQQWKAIKEKKSEEDKTKREINSLEADIANCPKSSKDALKKMKEKLADLKKKIKK